MLIKRVLTSLVLVAFAVFVLSVQVADASQVFFPQAGPCVNLSDPATWAGKVSIVGNSSFILNNNITLCGNYTTDTIHPLFLFNGSYTLDCNGSTITGGGLSRAVLSMHNNSVVQNCVFQDFGFGLNTLSIGNAAPSLVFNWSKNWSSGADYAQSVVVDQEGYYIFGGSDNNGGDGQWAVVKLDRNGNEVWNWTRNWSSGSDGISSVAVDKDGNYILGGSDDNGGDDMWRIVKLNNDGKFLWTWAKNWSSSDDAINSVAVDNDNNYIFAGGVDRGGVYDWGVLKLDSEGNELWDKNIAPSVGDDPNVEVAVDQSGNYILLGGSTIAGIDTEWYAVKLLSNSSILWNWSQNPSVGFDLTYGGPAVDLEGNYIFGGVDHIPGGGDFEWRVVKVDSDGNTLWNWTQAPCTGWYAMYGLNIDNDNGILAVGNDNIPGNTELRFVKIDSDGNTLWNWTDNPSGSSDNIYSVAVDQEGHYIVSGHKGSAWFAEKLSPERRNMSGVLFENVSIYKRNLSTYLATPNASATLTNFAVGFSSSIGKIVYSTLANVGGSLSTTWNLLLGSTFVSLNASDSSASSFNVSANITLDGTRIYGFKVYKLAGFPSARTDIVGNGTQVTPAYTAIQGSRATFSTVNAFSGYAITANPRPKRQAGGGSSSSTGVATQTVQQQVASTATEIPASKPLPEVPKKTVAYPNKVTTSPPKPVQAPVQYVQKQPKRTSSESAIKITFYLLCIGALVLLGFMLYWHNKPKRNKF